MHNYVGWPELERAILVLDDPHHRNAIHPLFIAFKAVFRDKVDDWIQWCCSASEVASEDMVNRAILIIRSAVRPQFSEQLKALSESEKAVLVKFVTGGGQ